MRMKGLILVGMLGAVAGLGACDDDPTGNDSGTIQVQVATSGAGTDANGYVVSVNNGAETENVTVQDTVNIQMDAGSHTVALTDVATNCTVGGTNPRTVALASDETEVVAFAVTCTGS